MGPEVTRDEIVQAEPSREALHAWVKVGGRRMCQLLLRVYSAEKEEGRESPAGLDCLGPLDSTHWWGGGRFVGGNYGQLGGSSKTQETGSSGHPPAGCQC